MVTGEDHVKLGEEKSIFSRFMAFKWAQLDQKSLEN